MDGQGGRAFSVPVRVGGSFSKPTIGIDAESLAKAGLQRTLQNVLTRSDKKDGEEGEETDEAEDKDPARTILEGILGGGSQKEKDDGTDQEASAKSVEETLINEGLNALFKKKAATTKEEAPAEPQ